MLKNNVGLRRKEALTGLAYAALPLTGFAVFYIIPFGITISQTFSGGMAGFNFVGLNNYISIMNSASFRLAAVNTLKFIAIGVPLLMFLSLSVALLLRTKPKGADGFRTAFFIPLVLPTASVVLVLRILFDKGGAINYLLDFLGKESINALRSSNAFWMLVLLYIWKNIGYGIILMLSGLNQIPRDYYEAARLDGAGNIIQLRRITLPLMGPTFFFVLVISIVGAFKSFREAYALFGTYPDDSIYMLQHFMNNNFARLNYQRLSVAAVLTFLMIFVFVLVMFIHSGRKAEQ